MSWSDTWKIMLSIVGGLGGSSFVFAVIVKFLSNHIAEKLSKKYELKLSKELEKYKNSLENKTYISKTKFDTEFAIYRELSANFSDAVKAVNIMIPSGLTNIPADREERLKLDKQHYDSLYAATVKAQDSLKANIPFISEDIFNGYNMLLGLFNMQLHAYEDRFLITDLRPQAEKESFSRGDYMRTREINDKWTELNNQIRKYLTALDVIE